MLLSECAALLRKIDSRSINDADLHSINASMDPEVAGVCLDSRRCRPGDLFVAISGVRDDGRRYIPDAVHNGAVAVVTDANTPVSDVGVPCLTAENVRRAVGTLADAFAGRPSSKLRLLGVTGTNGKTTTAYLLRHLFNRAGERCGMLGTVEYDDGASPRPSPLTTPDAVEFTAALKAMVEQGCRAAAVEVSSHALMQERVWPHRFSAAVFTNLSRDHLDYHGDMAAYAAAKARLFAGLDTDATAILNADDPAADRMADGVGARLWAYAIEHGHAQGAAAEHAGPEIFGRMTDHAPPPEGRWLVRVHRCDASGSEGTLSCPGQTTVAWRSPLVGLFNVQNALGAVLAAWASGLPRDKTLEALADFPGVPGRMERIALSGGGTAFVDYAHTDDALRTALSTLRGLSGGGRLTVVFGCGGDRDRGKRPLMAAAAEALADRVVVTSDNPRTEDPEQIFADIRAGFSEGGGGGGKESLWLADRAEAVARAVAWQERGDILLVAGKGHEDYQIIGTEKRPLDDRDLVRRADAGHLADKAN